MGMVKSLVKGVHQSIIEITDTGSDCFERAILFIRPEKQGQNPDHLAGHANSYLASIKLRKGILRGKFGWSSAIKLGSAAAAGAGITAILLQM